jgi:single-stranded-DNA-specific exonuclease
VVGIVAGRLKDRHAKPSFVAGFDATDIGRGSPASVPGVDVGALGATGQGGGRARRRRLATRWPPGSRSAAQSRTVPVSSSIRTLSRSARTILVARDLVADAIVSAGGATLALLDD